MPRESLDQRLAKLTDFLISVSDVKFDFTLDDAAKVVAASDAAEAEAANASLNNNMPVIRKKASSFSNNECAARIGRSKKRHFPQFAPKVMFVSRQEHDYVGMFEYKGEQLQQVLKALIYDLKAKTAAQMLPGLPAYILFMMIR